MSFGLPTFEIIVSKPRKKTVEPQNLTKAQATPKIKEVKPQKKPSEKKTSAATKTTKKAIKKSLYIWPVKFLLSILDLLAAPFGFMAGKDINFPLLWKVGCGFIGISFWLWALIHSSASGMMREIGMSKVSAASISFIIEMGFPGFIAIMGSCMVIGGIRLQNGRSFLQKYGAELEPLPAFEAGFALKLGDIKMSLRDAHTGIGAFGGVGSGKTVSVMVPLMRQFFRQLRDPNDTSEYAKCGALILDEKGDFIDSTITEMLLAGRSLQDLIIVDPDLDLYRYNPLDPHQSADENAAKLAKVQKILGTSSGGDNAYWDQTSQTTIKCFLQLLEVYKPKHKIGMDDIARFMRDDELATVLCDTVEESIEKKKTNNEISEEAYGIYTDAISATRNAWIQLNPNTKSTLKTTITNMLGPIASNPRLQKVFCRDTNFSFKDLPNKGKIVLFRGSGVDKGTAKLICVCLKIDFQTWQKRRNGSAASAYGLNTMRTVLFFCDEYQEFVTCGGEGDETFYGVSRSTRTAPVIATQSYNSLKTAIKNEEQTKTLRQNIATWVFCRTTDQDTCQLGEFLAGKSKKEDFSSSQDTTGFLETASNLGGGGGNKGSTINISKKLEENFRQDDFSRLVTMTMEKSKTGPWYSEAIIYHYHDIDENAESRCYKTRLPHLYYDNKLRKQASLNVEHLNSILYDRNWQRKALVRSLILIQKSIGTDKTLLELALKNKKSKEETDKIKAEAENNIEQLKKIETIKELTARTNQAIEKETEALKEGSILGAMETDEELSKEELEHRLQELEKEKENTIDEDQLNRIQIEIYDNNRRLAKSLIIAAYKTGTEDQKVEVLRSNSMPESDPEEGETPNHLLNPPLKEVEIPEDNQAPENDDLSLTIDPDEEIEELWSINTSAIPSYQEDPNNTGKIEKTGKQNEEEENSNEDETYQKPEQESSENLIELEDSWGHIEEENETENESENKNDKNDERGN